MAQHDYVIANDTAANVRSDLNDALSAIVSQNSGATAPSTTYANMLWYDTANNILKIRSEADDAWINVGYLDQSANAFRILDDTQVVNTSGTQTGLLGDQTEATWETGTSTTASLVRPSDVKAAIEALASSTDVASEIASFSAGGVGTYCFAYGSSDVAFGGTTSGSNLRPTSAVTSGSFESAGVADSPGDFDLGTALSGTWRAMGTYEERNTTGTDTAIGATLWLRIS